MLRIGTSWDQHNLIPGTGFKIGGQLLLGMKNIEAYSDGDVVFHSVGEAIIGALNLGDLGDHFNEKNQKPNFNSKIILEWCREKLIELSATINNIDILIILDTPNLKKYKEEIKNAIAQHLKIDVSQINVKATTSENNMQNIIQCLSSVLVEK
ncbi:2-C-methyl-D-erythritol 2,4-cyclodiphosphate synthase [Spiroplasma endosymbiont of Labia minor]|uniref:2-C-methyl-D-erythritol 2,4-cyclodiphosphate synthase n=1 Tax=Spiroplasma endosymbiont of Labia minor TaxID=3066305 RepID=UPI0030D464A9